MLVNAGNRARRGRPFLLALTSSALFATSQETLPVDTTVQTTPVPQVTVAWEEQASGVSVQVFRRELGKEGLTGGNGFTAVATTAYPATAYADTAVSAGVAYEYKVIRPSFAIGSTVYNSATTYVVATVDAPLVDARGGVLLVVDRTTAALLAPELALLEQDLTGDGWEVVRMDADPEGVGTPQALKAAIIAAKAAHPNIAALYLFGRLPIAISGKLAPDGHYTRPHATDLYYADLDPWTDTQNLTTTAGGPEDNVAGDGRLDQSDLPSAVELMTGRVDMVAMRYQRKNELEYLRDYIQKCHAWRHGMRVVPYRGLRANSMLFVEKGWLRAMFGAGGTTDAAFQPTLSSQAHVWAVDFGDFDNANPASYGGVDNRAIFFVNFGSGKQCWDAWDNQMRELLCQPDWGMNAMWGARPAFQMHHMAAGLPVGYSAMRTQNNFFRGTEYSPTGQYGVFSHQVAMSLMGDPTLRMQPVLPPSSVAASGAGTTASISWTAPADPARVGFHVYRSTSRTGVYDRLTTAPLAASATSYVDSGRPAGECFYQVRAIDRTSVPTGTFFNQSQGVFARLPAAGNGNSAPVATAPPTLQVQDSIPTPVAFPGTDADGDPLIPIVTANPQHGQLRWNGATACYVSAAGYTGTDGFTYRLFDGVNLSQPVQAAIEVAASRPDVLLAWSFGLPPGGGLQITGSTAHHAQVQPSTLGFGSSCMTKPDWLNDYALFVWMQQGASLDPNAYFEWTTAPVAGAHLNLRRLVFFAATSGVATSIAAPIQSSDFELRVSGDGFATWQTVPLDQGGESPTLGMEGHNSGRYHSADLAGIAALQDVTGPVAFRLYVWNAQYASIGRSGDFADQSAADLVVFGSPGTGNVPPIAHAGADLTLPDTDGMPGESVSLDGSASVDADGSIVSWTWTLGGTAIATGSAPTVTLADGVQVLTLTVIDDQGASSSDTVTYTVAAADTTPPTVPAGFTAAAVDGGIDTAWSASTDDTAVAGYEILVNGVVVATTTTTAYRVTGIGPGTVTVTVRAVDAAGNRSASSSPVTVVVPDPPTPSGPSTGDGGDSGKCGTGLIALLALAGVLALRGRRRGALP